MYDRAPRLLSQPTTGTSIDVGPGSYDTLISDRFRRETVDGYAPFLSMSLRESFLSGKDTTTNLPGPGVYNPKVYDHIKGASTLANRSQRFDENHDDLPGPGSYTLSKADDWIKNKRPYPQFNIQAYCNSSNVLRQSAPPSIPSPGQALGYEESEDGTLVKQKTPHRDGTLGPAFYKINYDETEAVKKYRGIHFGKLSGERGFDYKGEDSPGPGTYDPYVKKSTAPIDFIIEEQRKKSGETKLPRYHELVTIFENKKAVPGPGHYEIKSQFQKPARNTEAVARPSFGSQAARFKKSAENSPSPGSYNDPRHALESCNRISGSKKSPFGQTSIRFAKEHHVKRTPGPGTYNHKDIASDLIRSAIATSSRKGGFGSTSTRLNDLHKRDEEFLPGPSHYNPSSAPARSNRTNERKKHAVFESTTERLATRKPEENSSSKEHMCDDPWEKDAFQDVDVKFQSAPPPGSYEVAHSFDRTQGKMLSLEKQKVRAKTINGGFLSSTKRFSQQRDVIVKKPDPDTPGPGNYNVKSPAVAGGLLVTKESRFKQQKSDVPGPGSYQLSPLIQHSVLKSTFNATLNNPVAHALEHMGESQSHGVTFSVTA